MSASARTLSVAVASSAEPEMLEACLVSIGVARDNMTTPAEVVVARTADAPDASELFANRPWASLIVVPGKPGVPELRGRGLAEARDGWVALTEDMFLAAPDWLSALEACLGGEGGVIGGAIGNVRKDALSHAAYLTDYIEMSPSRPAEASVPALSGSNVTYPPALRGDVSRWSSEGEWEHIIHARLLAAGARLRFEPSARVDHNATYGFGEILATRFNYGMDFARDRLRDGLTDRRLARVLLAPALPFLLTLRIARRTAGTDRTAFLAAFPFVFALSAAWIAGETIGYLRGRS